MNEASASTRAKHDRAVHTRNAFFRYQAFVGMTEFERCVAFDPTFEPWQQGMIIALYRALIACGEDDTGQSTAQLRRMLEGALAAFPDDGILS